MNKKSMKYLVGVLFSISMLAGCATSGTHAATEPFSAKLTNYKKINVVLVSNNTDATAELKTIQTTKLEIRADSRHPKVASTPVDAHATGVLQVKLEIVDFQAPSGMAHFFLGPLAGPDRVAVNGTFYDMATGRKIGTFTSSGEAHLGGIVVGDTGTYRASTQLGEEIAALIKDNQ